LELIFRRKRRPLWAKLYKNVLKGGGEREKKMGSRRSGYDRSVWARGLEKSQGDAKVFVRRWSLGGSQGGNKGKKTTKLTFIGTDE